MASGLRSNNFSNSPRKGLLNLFNNKIEDCYVAGIVEPLKVKTQAISSATEVANMILRIDDVLVSSGSSAPQQAKNPYSEMD